MQSGVIIDRSGLPSVLLRSYERYLDGYERRPSWEKLTEGALWRELCFCILSSNVPYEMASSAVLQLSFKGLLDSEALRNTGEIAIARELKRPIYLPERIDRSYRVYRFARRRAFDIVGAWRFVYSENSGLSPMLGEGYSFTDLRAILVAGVPGVGFKEASHFLRNVKYTDSIAVLDSHVLSFMNSFVSPVSTISSLTPRRYVQLESLLVQFAHRMGLCPAILDMAIWEYMRRN